MNPYRMAAPPSRWVPKLSPWLVQMTRGHRRRRALRECQLTEIDVQNAEVVRQALDAGQGVLITPNHPTHADAYTTAAAADACGCPFYYMATWHVFDSKGRFGQWVLQKFGVFSIDREGTDLEAVKIARGILREKSQPLVIFPEGEVYHCNDRITPFREGAAAIAMFSARKATRPIVAIPAALKYRYVEDPTADLLKLMDTLEESIHWRPRPDLDLPARIYALGGALMALKELEFLSEVRSGSLPERTDFLARHILTGPRAATRDRWPQQDHSRNGSRNFGALPWRRSLNWTKTQVARHKKILITCSTRFFWSSSFLATLAIT